ncbi:uncharacterized protein [Triticum aestivum]|uniref:uncharacterized protein n=1 Tax=Triticum aestivum TaxID=4565 RepID=UPI001D03159B|nr:uncharacterized protein LOC123187620 [Triticum aestivum]
MRLSLLNSWVGRPLFAVAGVAGNRRRGEPLPLPAARTSGRLKTPGQAGPSPRDPTWQRLGVDPTLGPCLSVVDTTTTPDSAVLLRESVNPEQTPRLHSTTPLRSDVVDVEDETLLNLWALSVSTCSKTMPPG